MRRDSQHGRIVDDAMAEGTKNLKAGSSSRSGYWRDPEVPIEDEPGGDPLATERTGTPVGMSSQDVDGRFELARFVETGRFPADAERIRQMAVNNNAPDTVLAELARLPAGNYESVTEVWAALGGGTESPRDGS